MRIPICFELRVNLKSGAFRGPVFLAGQAIIEGCEGTWRVVPNSPAGIPFTASSVAEAIDLLESATQVHLSAAVTRSADALELESNLGQMLARVDSEVHEDWLALADGIKDTEGTVEGIRIESTVPARPEQHLGNVGQEVVAGFKCFVPGNLARRRAVV